MPIFRIVALLLLALVPFTASSQSAGAEGVFRSQLIELHTKAIAILDRVEKAVPRGAARQQTAEEIFALVRLIHRLEEEADATNLQFQQRGQPSNKGLLLIQQASKSIDGMFAALSSYVETDDRSFLSFAKENNSIAFAIRKVL